MSKSYDESKHVRNQLGQYANKIKEAKPGALPAPDIDPTVERKVDPSLFDYTLDDYAEQQPILIVTMAGGERYMGRAHVDAASERVTVPLPDAAARMFTDNQQPVLGTDGTGTLRVNDMVLRVQQGAEQDLQNEQLARALLEYEDGGLTELADTPTGGRVLKGANFTEEESARERANHLMRVFNGLKDAGYVPEQVKAKVRVRRHKKDFQPATEITFTAPKGMFYAVPHSMDEVYDRAKAGDRYADSLRSYMSACAADIHGDVNLAKAAKEGTERYMIPTLERERVRQVADELDRSFTLIDSVGRKQGGIVARFEER